MTLLRAIGEGSVAGDDDDVGVGFGYSSMVKGECAARESRGRVSAQCLASNLVGDTDCADEDDKDNRYGDDNDHRSNYCSYPGVIQDGCDILSFFHVQSVEC